MPTPGTAPPSAVDLRGLAVTRLVTVLAANLALWAVPPTPLTTLAALALGTVAGITASRVLVLPAVARWG